jgi:hypothetical protein
MTTFAIVFLRLSFFLCGREVSLKRSEDGSLGISIKGGREHNLPILISRLSSTDEAARYQYFWLISWTNEL